MVHDAYDALARIWSALNIFLSNVRSSEISTKTSHTSSSVQIASPGKCYHQWK